jgi:putative PIN family toxin of toxin-antitoxin system
MKVVFDTNVYVAEALLGEAAEAMLAATEKAQWRIYVSDAILDETEHVLVDYLGFSPRLARLTRQRCMRRAKRVSERPSRHEVADDPKDSPILQAGLEAGADYLVTNDQHLLKLDPYEGLRIISMADYLDLLKTEGHVP